MGSQEPDGKNLRGQSKQTATTLLWAYIFYKAGHNKHSHSLNSFPFFSSCVLTGRAELNAPIPAQDPFGPTEPWPEHTRQPQGAAGYGP